MTERHFDLQGTITIPASGGGSYRFDGPSLSEWRIERAIFVRQAGGAGSNELVSIYVGSVDAAGRRDGTSMGTVLQNAVADEASPIRVPVGTPFFAGISGGTAGDVFVVTLQIITDEVAAEEAATAEWQQYGSPDSLISEPGHPDRNRRRLPVGRR